MKNAILLFIALSLSLAACGPAVQQTDPGLPAGVECILASDCEGMAHAACEGQWSCVNGQCTYPCEQPEEPAEVAPEPVPPVQEETPDIIVEPVNEFEIEQTAHDYVLDQAVTKFISLSPTYKLVEPGEGFASAFAIKNNLRIENRFNLDAYFDKAYTEGNQPIFVNETKMMDWIEIPGNRSIANNEIYVYKVVVRVPDEEIAPGTYEFGLQAQQRDDQWKDYYGELVLAVKVK